jgi:RsiW-degrading membrane proteinase PrsW (M82 family)
MKELALTIPGNGGDIKIIPPAGILSTGGPSTLSSIISVGLNLAVVAAIIVCLFMLIWGGFDWMFSEGDKQKVANARNRLVMAIIGLFVVFLSFMIINIVYTFFFGANVTSFLMSQGS